MQKVYATKHFHRFNCRSKSRRKRYLQLHIIYLQRDFTDAKAQFSCSVLTFENGFFIFQFNKDVDVSKILEDGQVYCGNRLVILKKWYPGIRMCKEEFSSVPVWMKFFNVPLELWTQLLLRKLKFCISGSCHR